MSDEPKTSRCRAATDVARCSFHGTRDELRDHADEMGHPRCVVCAGTLAWHEQQTCSRCVARVRDDLDAILTAYAQLEQRIDDGAYSGGWLTALAVLTDGAIYGGGDDDHVRYRDLWPIVAVLESADREWREEFGHRVTYKPLGHPDRHLREVLETCASYLQVQHVLAARTHPGFDDYAETLRITRGQVEHVAGLANDPVRAPAQCFDCTGQLVRTYTDKGLTDDWTCRGCGRVYDQPSYFLALRAMPSDCQGWVPVKIAAAALRVPESTLFRWVSRGEVATMRENGRTFVEWSEVSEKRERRAS